MTEQPKCKKCQDKTVKFCGSGANMQYWICPEYKNPGHLSESQINKRISQVRRGIKPSGRMA